MEKQIGNPIRCGARSKNNNGEPCKGRAMANGRCRFHGGKSTGPKDPSKLEGNKHALKTGEYENIALDALDEEELELIEKVDTDPMAQLDEAIQIAKLRERRMLIRIAGLKQKQQHMVNLEKEVTIERSRRTYRHTVERYEDTLTVIQKIEDALIRNTRVLNQLIATKHKILTENGPIEVDVNVRLAEYEEALNAIAGEVWADDDQVEEDLESEDVSEYEEEALDHADE